MVKKGEGGLETGVSGWWNDDGLWVKLVKPDGNGNGTESKSYCKGSISFTRYLNFSQRYQENPIYFIPSNPIYKNIGGQIKKSGSERLLQI